MPLTYETAFRVRHYECDIYGHVNQANYLRYMQEAAFEASAAAGYSMERYAAMKRAWFIRETDIEYHASLHYGDTLRIKTWVKAFRRVHSPRIYELYNDATGELVARAESDWAYVDTTTGHPAPIPPEMIAAFMPEGNVPQPPARNPLPPAQPLPPQAFRWRRWVEWRDLDPAQHVNNAVYLSYMEDCAIHCALSLGWPVARMLAEGFAIVARHHTLAYHQPARLNDELEIATWLTDITRATAVRHFTVTRLADQALLAHARTHWAWLNPTTNRIVRIPALFLADFKSNIAET